MRISKQIRVGEKQLTASGTVNVLEVSSAELWAALQSPLASPISSSMVFLEANIMVVGELDSYAVLLRVLARANAPAPFTGLSAQRKLLWETLWDESPIGYISDFDMSMSGDTLRVTVDATSSVGDATTAKATTWLKAWANG